jgi:ABC-type multidrug transport system fused ATPase/permease subunit
MIEQQVLDKSSLKLSPKIVEEESDFIAKVKLEGVTFKYEQSGVELLKSINCEIFPGEIIALVGPSGSGKSTLIDILLGIFPPDAGKVLISGLDPLDAFRKWPGAVAYVPQETCVIMGTIKENLALGLNELNFTEEKYWGALGKAKLEDFVRSLPEGLNTIINDQGNNLSGGQRQRLGIARALLTNPQILILDEATSALDVETEFAISEVIQSLGGNTTVLTIAHRLSSIRSSNRLIYLAHGEITEAKSFEELRKLVPNFDRQLQIMGL